MLFMSCQVAELPMTYLGLPLGSSFKSKSEWSGVIEKMERCLAGWKRMSFQRGSDYVD